MSALLSRSRALRVFVLVFGAIVVACGGSSPSSDEDANVAQTKQAVCTAVTLTPSDADRIAVPGETVTWTATPTCGGTPQYEFWQRDPQLVWTLVQPWSSSNTLTWNTPSAGLVVGDYAVQVRVRDVAGSPGFYQKYINGTFALNPYPVCTGITTAVSPSTASIGTTVTLTSSTTGCPSNPPPEFRVWHKRPGRPYEAEIVQPVDQNGYTTNPVFTWDTQNEPVGTHNIHIYARAPGSRKEYEVYSSKAYNLQSTTPCKKLAATFEPVGSAPVGSRVLVSVTSTNCPQPEYAYLTQKTPVSAGNYRAVAGWTLSPTAIWNTRLSPPGTYQYFLRARAAGTAGLYDSYEVGINAFHVLDPFTPTSSVSINGGDDHFCELKGDGKVGCWGYSQSGALGSGGAQSLVPIGAVGLAQGIALAAGDNHSCAVVFGGGVRCWGDNSYGQLGNGTFITSSTPVTVSGIAPDPNALEHVVGYYVAVAVALGSDHSCALISDGSVRCWGRNSYGQLGDRSTTDRSEPVLVQGITDAIDVAAGTDHTCVIRRDRSVRCWGRNNEGQLGNNSQTDSLDPQTVSGLTNVTSISANSDHSCAVISGGAVRCWGANANGNLGNNSTTRALTAVPVSNITQATNVAVGRYHSCASLQNGAANCWGHGANGELGTGQLLSSLVPVPVTGITNATSVGVSTYASCATLTDNTAKCWGYGALGTLGTGNTNSSSAPVSTGTWLPDPGTGGSGGSGGSGSGGAGGGGGAGNPGATCTTDANCAAGQVCGFGMGPRFGLPAGTNVCWATICSTSPTVSCGSLLSPCGLCGAGGECDSDADCAVGTTCSGPSGTPPNVCVETTCTPQCEGKQCGDDASDHCGGSCAGFCAPGQAGCRTSMDCPASQTCGIGMGPRFGLATGVNVCWPQACEVQDTSLPNRGVDPAACGVSPECGPSCGPNDTGPNGCGAGLYCADCPLGETRGASGMCTETIAEYLPNGSNFPRWPVLTFGTILPGAIPGAFSVTEQGRANYRVPIEVPPGRLGMQPGLAFVYNGSKANGLLGIGWSLSGLSSITRCPQIIAREGQAQAVIYEGTDTFCLDGQALLSPRGGVDYFRTEIDDFSRIYARNAQGSNVGAGENPSFFEVFAKDGRVRRYGFTSDSSVSSTSAVKRVWALDRVLDVAGNRLDIRYVSNATQLAWRTTEEINAELRRAAGQQPATLPASSDRFAEAELLPLVISYGGARDLAAQNHTRFVYFQYETRPDPQFLYSAGFGKNLIHRLKSVTTYVGEREAKRYVPTYSPAVAPGGLPAGVAFNTSDEVISRVQVLATDYTAHDEDADTSKLHELGPGTAFFTVPLSYNWNEQAWAATVPSFLGQTLDLNGDGLTDIVYSQNQKTRIRLATTVPGTSAYTYVDLAAVVSNGMTAGGPANEALESWNYGDNVDHQIPKNRLTAIDIDRNGQDELLFNTVYLSYTGHDGTTASFVRRTDLGPALPPTLNVVYDNRPTTVWQQNGLRGDWNGDGLPDLAICTDDKVGATQSRLTVFLSEVAAGVGARFELQSSNVPMASGIPCTSLEVLDTDSDGRDEIVRPAVKGDPTGLSSLPNFAEDPQNVGMRHFLDHGVWTQRVLSGVPTLLVNKPSTVQGQDVVPRISGDFNGDGLRDLISVETPLDGPPKPTDYNEGNDREHRLTLWKATGGGGYEQLWLDFGVDGSDLNTEIDLAHADISNAVAMDWNGDGRDELIIGNNTDPDRLDSGTWPGRSNGIWIGVISGRSRIKFSKVTDAHHGRLRVISDLNGDQVPELVDTNSNQMLAVAPNHDAGRLYEVLNGLGRLTQISYDEGSRYSRAACSADLVAGYECMKRPSGLVASYEEMQIWNGQGCCRAPVSVEI